MRNSEVPWRRVGEDLWDFVTIATLTLLEFLRKSMAAQTILAVVGFTLMIAPLWLPLPLTSSAMTWTFLTAGVVLYTSGFLLFIRRL